MSNNNNLLDKAINHGNDKRGRDHGESEKTIEEETISNDNSNKRVRSNGPDETNTTTATTVTTATSTIQSAALAELPQTSHYHVSYMHRQVITHVVTSLKHGYVLTASVDGVVKFWKRTAVVASTNGGGGVPLPIESSGLAAAAAAASASSKCLEFVKSFVAHLGPIVALVMSSPHEDMAASIGLSDGILKLYDISTFDVAAMLRIDPSNSSIIQSLGSSAIFWADSFLALTSSANGDIYILDVHQTTETTTAADDLVNTDNLDHNDEEESLMKQQQSSSSSLIRHVIKLHAAPVTALTYNIEKQCVLSADSKGILEMWDCSAVASRDGPTTNSSSSTTEVGGPCTAAKHGITFTSKMDTDLYHLLRKKTHAIAMTATLGAVKKKHSSSGYYDSYYYYAMYCADHKVRFMDHATAKIILVLDESTKVYDSTFSTPTYAMDIIDYGKRAAMEREIQQTTSIFTATSTTTTTTELGSGSLQRLTLAFDPTGRYILIPTLVGIKIMDWQRRRLVAIVGKADASQLRFLTICPCWGDAKVNRQMQLARTGGSSAAVSTSSEQDVVKPSSDALILALAYQQRRVYVFSHVDPCSSTSSDEATTSGKLTKNSSTAAGNTDDRDVWNEPPDANEQLGGAMMWAGNKPHGAASAHHKEHSKLGSQAVLRTTLGDIHIKLFPDQVPKTIENFCEHARAGYYDNVIFHRIIKGFMIQTGDPLGDGTGGESIWGGEFEDEFVRDLRHDRPFTVSMANAGPNTNGSQFFITTVPTPWLDNKHTVFGRVTKGMDICTAIENVKTNHLDKPYEDILITSIDILS